MGTVTHFAINDPVAALTFDDGPNPECTPRLLDILENFKVHATFFLIGEAAEKHPDLVLRIFKAGHTVGNHSWDHQPFLEITRKERRKQIRACGREISPYGARIFRPPWGAHNLSSELDAFLLRYKVIAWNLQVGDWLDTDSHHMADLLMKRIRPGSVVLLHDAIISNPRAEQVTMPFIDREPMLIALTSFLERVGQNFRFVTIPEMFRLGNPIRPY